MLNKIAKIITCFFGLGSLVVYSIGIISIICIGSNSINYSILGIYSPMFTDIIGGYIPMIIFGFGGIIISIIMFCYLSKNNHQTNVISPSNLPPTADLDIQHFNPQNNCVLQSINVQQSPQSPPSVNFSKYPNFLQFFPYLNNTHSFINYTDSEEKAYPFNCNEDIHIKRNKSAPNLI